MAENKSIIAPEKFIVGFQLRCLPGTRVDLRIANQYDTKYEGQVIHLSYDKVTHKNTEMLFTDYDNPLYYKLGFATYKDKNKIRKEYSWNQWCWAPLGTKEFDNVPTPGFRIAEVTQRSTDWFGSGRNMWEIYDPRGFRLEINSDNLMALLENCNVIDGVFSEPMIWAWSGISMALVSTNSDLYKTTLDNTARIKRKVSLKDVKVGNRIRLKNGKEGIYMGRFYSFIENEKYNRGNYEIEFRTPYLHYLQFDRTEEFKAFLDGHLAQAIATLEVADILDSNEVDKNFYVEHINNIICDKESPYNALRYDGYIRAISETPLDPIKSFKCVPMSSDDRIEFFEKSTSRDTSFDFLSDHVLIRITKRRINDSNRTYNFITGKYVLNEKYTTTFAKREYTIKEATPNKVIFHQEVKRSYAMDNEKIITREEIQNITSCFIITSFGDKKISFI